MSVMFLAGRNEVAAAKKLADARDTLVAMLEIIVDLTASWLLGKAQELSRADKAVTDIEQSTALIRMLAQDYLEELEEAPAEGPRAWAGVPGTPSRVAPCYNMASTGRMNTVGKQLRGLRLRAGLSLEQAAQAMGLVRASSAQHYEDDFKKAYLPLDKVASLAKVLVGRGDPPITEDEVFALAGGDQMSVRRVLRKPRDGALEREGMVRKQAESLACALRDGLKSPSPSPQGHERKRLFEGPGQDCAQSFAIGRTRPVLWSTTRTDGNRWRRVAPPTLNFGPQCCPPSI